MASQIAPADIAAPATRRQLREAEQAGTRRSRRRPTPAAPAVAQDKPAHTGHPAARWGVRSGVLVTLAAVTVAVPLTQHEDRSVAATGESTVDDANLPSTVEALTGTPGSTLVPPSSLLSTDAAEVRSEVAASRSAEREILPGCSGQVANPNAPNGQLPSADLCTLWDGGTQLRADAAEALAELNAMYVAKFGSDMCLSSGYRTLAQQSAVKASRGSFAAATGKSNHGFGLAVDFCSGLTTGVQWDWLNENAATFGWENPAWAKPGGSGPYERWHWEYTKVQTDGFYYGE
ncbi:M15 family metallopeptidase [Cellulomonas taurus]|uniref:M15 family metallopeptidase n=1 Tax=Cellulomonas taurus TaxID=2729175 RepID=UPI001FE9EA33|nr:M15 family metallopeptidase [Cellulomonas taurus]